MLQPETPYTPEQEIARAEEARQVLDAPIFKEICTAIEEGLARQRNDVPLTETLMHTRLILTEQVWNQVKQYLEMVKQTGQMARLQLAEKERLRERMRRMMSLGLRE